MIPTPPPQSTPCSVRWATSDGGTQWCPGLFLAFVPAVDTEYRVLVRGKTPRGGARLAEVHPDSVRFVAEALPCC